MLSHGGHARDLNLWVSKLRNYNSKHFQHVDRTPRYTLYCNREASKQNDQTARNQTTDLQRCVQLLSHVLETDGSLMGGPAVRRQAPKRATKPKKKRVHVVPQPKLLGKNVLARGSLARGSLANMRKGKPSGKAQKGVSRFADTRGTNCSNCNGGATNVDRDTQPPLQQWNAGSDVSEPVPYNTRLASSTPNNTVLKEVTSDPPVSRDAGSRQTSASPTKTVGINKGRLNAASTKRGGHDCKQFRKDAPGLPLVFLNMDYSLTPGQSNQLNSSSQVNIAEPPEAKAVPKLIHGRVEFQPNPSAWFNANKSNMTPASHDAVQNSLPKSDEQCGIGRPARFEGDCQSNQLTYPLDPPEREVNFSLYTNPGDYNTGAEDNQLRMPPSTAAPTVQQVAAHKEEQADHRPASDYRQQTCEMCNAQSRTSGTPSSSSADIIEIPTGLKESSPEVKAKRLASKNSEPSCSRLNKSSKKKHPVKSRGTVLRRNTKSTVDKAVQFAISNAATQCSPERDGGREMELLNWINICTDPCMSQQSMRHMMTLQCLLDEMKSLVKSEQNSRLELLVKQVEQTAAMFVPGLGGIDWRTELELAIQPLRTENAQLRRRLRISNQQLKETKRQLERSEKPDPSFHTVHLELLQQKMKQDLDEAKSGRDKLRDRLKDAQAELEKVRAERAKLLEIMVNKDAEHHKAEQKLREDVARHRRDTERALEETNRALRERDLLQKQLQVVHISLDQRDKEIARLRNIVRNLQDSMRQLLGKLKSMSPSDELINTFIDGEGHNLLDGDVLLINKEKRSPADVGTPAVPADPGHSSARRVLPFSNQKAQAKPSHSERLIPLSREQLNATSSPRVEGTGQEGDAKWSEESLNDTDYITAPGTSPMKKFFSRRSVLPATDTHPRHLCNGAPTVKELLTPLKDRLQTQYKRLSAESRGRSHEGNTELPAVPTVPEEEYLEDLQVAPLDDTLQDISGDVENNNTLQAVEGQAAENKPSSDEVSRYSITDYFRKYRCDDDNTLAKQLDHGTERSDAAKLASSDEDDRSQTVDAAVDSDYGEALDGRRSDDDSQQGVYKGTALETSISTISDAESIASSAMTMSSAGTIDDSNFQQGLADLDANIARIQAQLQASLAQYS